jgi:hypothetical protein
VRPVLAGAPVVHKTSRPAAQNRPVAARRSTKKTSKGDRRMGNGRCEHRHPSGRQCAYGRAPGQRLCDEHLRGGSLCAAQTPDGPCEHRVGHGGQCPEHGKSAVLDRARQKFLQSTKRTGAGGLKGEAKRRFLAEERKKHERAELVRCQPSRRVAKSVYQGVPMWHGRAHWHGQGEALFHQWRDYLVQACGLPFIAVATFVAYLVVLGDAADGATGRNVRLCREEIGKRMAERLGCAEPFSTTTVTRCRRYAVALGLLTVIAEGRERTSAERQSAHRAKDKSHGWAPLLALHPSLTVVWPETPAEPVDYRVKNLQLKTKMTTYPRSGQVSERTSVRMFLSLCNTTRAERSSEKSDGAARRSTEKEERRRRRKAPSWDERTLALELDVRSDPDMPGFVRSISPGELRSVLNSRAKSGWILDDVREGIRFFLKRHPHKWLDHPDRPARFLWWVLRESGIQIEWPPSRKHHLKDTGPSACQMIAKGRATRERGEAFLAANSRLVAPRKPLCRPLRAQEATPAQIRQERAEIPPAANTEAPVDGAGEFTPVVSERRRAEMMAELGLQRFMTRLRDERNPGGGGPQ